MKIAITGRGIELTDGLKEAVTAKLSKLDRFFTPDTRANVTLSVEKERQKIEVTIPVKGHTIRAEEASDDMYTSINEVEEVIERQLRRYRTRIIDKAQDGPKSADDVAYFSSEFMDSGEEAFEEEDADIVSGDIRSSLETPRPTRSMLSTSARSRIPTGLLSLNFEDFISKKERGYGV